MSVLIKKIPDCDSDRLVYLDYAATTPVDPKVIEVMNRHLGGGGIFGNPSSRSHEFGRMAEESVEIARDQLAELINADSSEIIWTSGATESINLAIKGVAYGCAARGRHIVTSKLEHKAVLDSCAQLAHEGFDITYVEPDKYGLISPEIIEEVLTDETILVSLMHVNNEVGTITDIDAISQITRDRGIPFHVDAAQSCARLPIDVHRISVDIASFSGHKMYGPKGVGALYVRHRADMKIEPQMHGGGQELGIRPGTLATHQIAGMGEAARLIKQRLLLDKKNIMVLDDYLLERLKKIQQITLNGNQKERVAGIVNVGFAHVESESLMLSLKNVAISSGSACTSSSIESSHVLRGLGVSEDVANCSVRFSLGRQTTTDEIDFAAAHVRESVDLLRKLSSGWGLSDRDEWIRRNDETRLDIVAMRKKQA